jgi:semaphorin 5
VLTKYKENTPVHVLFVATREGTIKKLSYNTRTKKSCLVEILNPFANGRNVPIHNVKLFSATSSTSAIYMATEENVIRLPLHRCQRFSTQRSCLNAMDPYCGWNKQRQECSATPNNNPLAAYWIQSHLTCPILSDPVSFKN